MKILATSDLHSRRDWYEWLLKEAPRYDAVVIEGDLLDMFQELPPQVEFLRRWVAKMKTTGIPLFLCDGNHDFNSVPLPWSSGGIRKLSPEQAAFERRARLVEHWMDALVEEGASVVSGMTTVFPNLDNLIVTSLFYGHEHEETNTSLLGQGARHRQGLPRSHWIVLHHEPPVGLVGSAQVGNRRFGALIDEYQPKIVFSGHDHESPALNGTCCDRIGLSYVFNPGHRAEGDHPCHIDLDTRTMKYRNES